MDREIVVQDPNKPPICVVKSPLKWAGGKSRLIKPIWEAAPKRQGRWVEPFVGSGVVSMNMFHCKEHIWVDNNPDLINFYQVMKLNQFEIIEEIRKLFVPQNNTLEQYILLREEFNQLLLTNETDSLRKAALFVYLNRHGFNGLCRYNNKGQFNVSFGSYRKPYFPGKELRYLSWTLHGVNELHCGDFEQAFRLLKSGDVVYCDPPYTPLSTTANFTKYSKNPFTHEDHERLVRCAEKARERGVTTLISNHFISKSFTEEVLYPTADDYEVHELTRPINRDASKRSHKVQELLISYRG